MRFDLTDLRLFLLVAERGSITHVPDEPFFDELAKRGIKVAETVAWD